MAGGRRTAAIVAAQYFRQIPCITTVYAGSSESRALLRISERGVSKAVLVKLSKNEILKISEENNISPQTFTKNYVIAAEGKNRKNAQAVCIFLATYWNTEHARPPDDRKLRELKPDPYWITVDGQHLLPKPGVWKYPPIPLNLIYA